MELRQYQKECVEAIWREIMQSQTALAVMSTGSGKSICFQELIRRSIAAKPDIKVLVLFDTVTLLSQQAENLKRIFPSVSIYCGSEGIYDLSGQIVVGMIQSIKPELLNFNLVVVDEVHMLNEEKGRYIDFLKHQIAHNPKTRVVGFTATPYRSDGLIYGKNRFFSHMCFNRGLRFFIDKGILVPPVAKQPDHQLDVSKLRVVKGEYKQSDIDLQTLNVAMAQDQVIDALNRAEGRHKVVWFCSSIKHAELIKDLLREQGEIAETVHSEMTWEDRENSMQSFMHKNARHLTFISVLTKGWDHPPVDCVVLMRPTRSPTLMVQVVGRGLRSYPGKESCLVLDYAQVIETMGPLENPVVIKKGKGEKKGKATQKACPQCRVYTAPNATLCLSCGYQWVKAEATKIMLTADENAQFLTQKVRQIEVARINMRLHIAKSGNPCVKIEYYPKGFFVSPVEEYFVWTKEFARYKFKLRAAELGIEFKDEVENQVTQPITRMPKSVSYVKDSQYYTVKSLSFE